MERSPGGIRMFQEKDYELLKIIECLKKAGMSIKDIKTYIELTLQGNDTIEQRLELFKNQKNVLLAQMTSLQRTLDVLDYKCWFYETAKEAGTTDVPQNMTLDEIPEKYRNIRCNLKDVPN